MQKDSVATEPDNDLDFGIKKKKKKTKTTTADDVDDEKGFDHYYRLIL